MAAVMGWYVVLVAEGRGCEEGEEGGEIKILDWFPGMRHEGRGRTFEASLMLLLPTNHDTPPALRRTFSTGATYCTASGG
jgi:hypothetical protein